MEGRDGERESGLRNGGGGSGFFNGARPAVTLVDPTGFTLACGVAQPSVTVASLARQLAAEWQRQAPHKGTTGSSGAGDARTISDSVFLADGDSGAADDGAATAPRHMATHFVTREGLQLDAAVPAACVGVRFVSRRHYNPRLTAMLPAFVLEQLLLEATGWTVLHARAFDVSKHAASATRRGAGDDSGLSRSSLALPGSASEVAAQLRAAVRASGAATKQGASGAGAASVAAVERGAEEPAAGAASASSRRATVVLARRDGSAAHAASDTSRLASGRVELLQ
jgi:hypothetical protein